MALVSKAWPSVPTGESTRSGLPVQAATPQAIAMIQNHLIGWRGRKAIGHLITCNAEDVFLFDDVPQQPVGGDSYTARVLWRTSPEAKFLYVAIHYAALSGGSKGPSLAAKLETVGGASVDKGCEWTLADGLLEAGGIRAPLGRQIALMKLATTGTYIDSTAGADVTGPRPLNIGTMAGQDVVLIVEGSEITLQSVSAWEMYEAEL